MAFKVYLKSGYLSIYGHNLPITCKVRTLDNKTRFADQVVYTVPGDGSQGRPYMPDVFPPGKWNITGLLWQKNGNVNFHYPTYGPCKILTDAYRMVKVWQLDSNLDYFQETNEEVKDLGYMLHWSESSTTLGCIRLATEADAYELGNMIDDMLRSVKSIPLEVIAL